MNSQASTNRLRERVAKGLTALLMGLYMFIGVTTIANLVSAALGAGG